MEKKNWYFVLLFGLISFAVGVVGVIGVIQGKSNEPTLVSFFLVYGFVLISVFPLIRVCQKVSDNQKIREILENQAREEAYQQWSREAYENGHRHRYPTTHDYRRLRDKNTSIIR